MTTYTLPADGVYQFDPPYHYGQHSLAMEGGGSITIEARHPGSNAWLSVPGNPLTPGEVVRFTGVVDEYRFTLSGSSGPVVVTVMNTSEGAGRDYSAPETGVGPSTEMAAGQQAITIQPYTEINVKRGLEFYFRASYPAANPIPASGVRKIYFATGDSTVLVKLRIFDYVGQELQIQIFEAPTGVTGGTPIVPSNWNRVNPQPSTVTITKDVTAATDGAPFDPEPDYFFGAATAPARDVSSIPSGRERVLSPNTEYLVVITNNDASAGARCQYFLDWYEGEPDLP